MGEGSAGGLGVGALPAGTVTFLFTDLEGSTRLLEAHPAAYRDAVRRHHALLRAAVEGQGGVVFETVGDAVYAAFARPGDAVAAALAGQIALREEAWGELGPDAVRARMALHTGEVELQGAHYFGVPLYRCARLTAAAHGGQVVLSRATAELVRDVLPAGAVLRDLGTHRLKDLARPERVFQLVGPGGPADFPALRALDARPHNLPVLRDPLVGRAAELAQVEALLLRQDVGLLTLTGPGGTGKTRLALQAAADLLDRFEDGVAFVALAPIREPDLVLPTVAAALGVRDAGARPLRDLVLDHLRSRRLLLLLDNFEQVLGAAPLVADLLAAVPRLTVLVTSRAVLRLSGEHEYPVPPLGVPGPGRPPPAEEVGRVEAVRLFVERARAARPDFALDAANAPAVAALCRRLDGLPLALELAAARVRVLPPRALLARLSGAHGADFLGLLAGGARDLPERQQTLRATIEWSYGLLTPGEQALFRRLGVFAGGCGLDAAESVASSGTGAGGVAGALPAAGALPPVAPHVGGRLLDGLESLVDASLLLQEAAPDGEPRFRMLQTVREFALAHLEAADEEQPVRQAHAAYCVALAEVAGAALTGGGSTGADRLEAEHDDLRAALRWSLDRGDAEVALQLSGALWRFWHIRGYYGEGRRWLERALATPEPDGARTALLAWRARALTGAGWLAHYQSDFGTAAARCGESLALCRRLHDRAGTAAALNGLALVTRTGGQYAAARVMYEESLSLLRELDNRPQIAYTLGYLGILVWLQGDYPAVHALAREALAVSGDLGDQQGQAAAYTALGFAAANLGDFAAAQAFLERALGITRAAGDRRGIARARFGLGRAALGRGDHPEAHRALEEAVAITRALGDRWFLSFCLDTYAYLAAVTGQYAPAARLCGAADGLLHALGTPRPPCMEPAYLGSLAAVRHALGEDALVGLVAAGRELALDEAIAEAAAAGEAACPTPVASGAPTTGPASPLSAREREVARLIARGLTNKQIAAELIIAEGTANRHVSNILGRLGFATRAQVAAWAAGRAV